MKQIFSGVFARIFFSTLASAAVVIAVLALGTYSMLDRMYEGSVRKMLKNSSELLCASIDDGDGIDAISKRCADYAAKSGIRTTIVASDGTVMFDSDADSSSMTNHLGRAEVKKALEGERNFSTHFSNTMKTKMLYVASPAGAERNGQFQYCVRQAMPIHDLGVAKRLFGYELVLLVGVAVLFSGVFSFFMARRIADPIKKLSLASSEFARGNFEQRAPTSDITEICDLGKSMTDMAKELKRRMNSLYKRNCELDEIFGHMSESVFICSKDGYLLRANSACMELFKINKNLPCIVAEAFRNSKILAAIDGVFESSTVACDVEIDGDAPKTYSLFGSMLPYEASAPRALFVMHDISYLSANETLRREFVAGVSHELKTPITAISIAAETLEEADDAADRTRFTDVIQKEAARMNMLVDDMLLLSKIEFAANMSADFGELNVHSVLEEACISHQNSAERAGDKIEIDCPDDIYIKGDFTLMQIAVSNLVGNAIKYGGKGSKIKVDGELIGGNVAISVSDTGMGIAPEHADRIFERFYRVDKGRSRAMGGTGLGLAIVKHIAILHSGSVGVKSKLGEGSKFTMIFKAL